MPRNASSNITRRFRKPSKTDKNLIPAMDQNLTRVQLKRRKADALATLKAQKVK